MVAARRVHGHVERDVAVGRAVVLLIVVCACAVAAPARALAEVDGGAGDADAPEARPAALPRDAGALDAGPTFEPPRALSDTHVPPPPGAPELDEPVVVTVKLLVDVTGAVKKAELLTPPCPPFDAAVLEAARAFKFEPGRFGGAPVPVAVTFTQRFLPRARPRAPVAAAAGEAPPAPGRALTSALRGRLVELGTRAAIAHATVSALVDGQYYFAESDADGRFRLPLPPGTARVSVYAADHAAFVQAETLTANQELAVTYLVERDRYNVYETVVRGARRREEVSRITLRGAEIQQVPGTFGDPFRVIQTLPGVSSVVSLLPFPIVRGASPASTGFLLDGTRVPLLFHLLSGPSVIHPLFIDEIQFFPGGAPAPYGGYVGGIVDGLTARARPNEHIIDIDLNLLQAGGLIREPIEKLGATFTAAARYGYPGLILSLATSQLSLSYWDYQLRLDGGNPLNGWTIFAYGAYDELDTRAAAVDPQAPTPPLEPTLELGFHRVDVRLHRTQGRLKETWRAVLGYDRTFSNGTDFWIWGVEPQAFAEFTQSERLRFDGGLLGTFRDLQQGAGTQAAANAFSAITSQLGRIYSESAYLEAIWRPTPRWLIRPGVRGDAYQDQTADKAAVDPRLTGRYRLLDRHLPEVAAGSDDDAVFLKASLGVYHQPPRFVLPLPGLDLMPLKYGLLRSYQSSLGAEIPLRQRIELSVEGFFNYMDPTIFDLSVNPLMVGTSANQTVVPTTVVMQPMDAQEIIDRLTKPQTGRAYGLEFLLRRRAQSGLFGWISYTLSRSERYHPAVPATFTAPAVPGYWAPYDYDRTHLFNLVAGLPLRRNWDIGVRLQYQSGRPATVTSGYNAVYGDGFFRFDFRIDKRAVYKKWLLDFYVDVTNAALLPEEVEPGAVIRYVLPTVGFRARL
jgi:TonB family protein